MAATPNQQPEGEAPIEIQLEGIAKRFGERAVLEGVDLTVRAGEIAAIVGGSGSGKTVLMDMMIGLIAPSEGTVRVANHAVDGAPLVELAELETDELDALRLHWSVVFQHNALFSGSVEDNVSLWLREHTVMSPREINRRVRRSLEAVDLDVDDVWKKDRSELSGGMAKRVAIARAIATDPKLIFYDEPTTGLDPLHAARIHELIFDTHHSPSEARTLDEDESLRTSIIVTHDKDLLRRVRPRVIMLHHRGVCFDGPYGEFGRTGCAPASEYLRAMPVLQAKPTPS